MSDPKSEQALAPSSSSYQKAGRDRVRMGKAPGSRRHGEQRTVVLSRVLSAEAQGGNGSPTSSLGRSLTADTLLLLQLSTRWGLSELHGVGSAGRAPLMTKMPTTAATDVRGHL